MRRGFLDIYLDRNISVILPNVVSNCPTSRPPIPTEPALVANSLYTEQEKHTMHKPDV
jgi:hypothetical protein